jgi:hypothetical protein
VGDTLDACRSSLRTFCEPACDMTGKVDLNSPLRVEHVGILIGPLCGSFVSRLDGRRFPVWWPNAMLVVP